MAALGNLALLLDVTSPRSGLLDWKTRPMPADVVLNLFKKDQNPNLNPSHNPHHHHHNSNPYPYLSFNTAATCFEFGTDNRNPRSGLRGKTNSKVNNAVDYDSSSDDDSNSNGNGEEKEGFDWEKQMRQRVKEIQEMKELEKKAEELQSRMDDDDGDGDETEEQKRMRVRKELEKVAKEQAERRKTAELMFDLGQRAYGRGMYGRAIEFLEAALTIIPRLTLFGGEIQIWLAMAYDANNRHSDCIGLYLELEKKHPSASIRRQAEELRYILQAPKLKISQEEMVSIPLIGSSYDSYAVTWTDKNKDREERSGLITNQLPSSKDYLADFLVWRPPVGLEKNQGFWVGLTLWLALVGAALYLQ